MILLFFAWLLVAAPTPSEVSMYDGRLNGLAREFRTVAMDRAASRRLYLDIGALAAELREVLRSADLSPAEGEPYREMLREVLALENYVSCVGDCGDNNPTIEQFYRANRRVGGHIFPLEKSDFRVEAFYVAVDGYTALMVQNGSSRKFRVDFGWCISTEDGNERGVGCRGVFEREVNAIWNNRGRPERKAVEVERLVCTDLGY